MSNCVVSLFDNIDGEIRRKHTSQEELCNYLGIERRTYLNWKNKKSMPVTYFIMCAKYLRGGGGGGRGGGGGGANYI